MNLTYSTRPRGGRQSADWSPLPYPMTAPLSKSELLGIGTFGQLVGAACFFLVIPFGIIFGVLFRLFGGTHRAKD